MKLDIGSNVRERKEKKVIIPFYVTIIGLLCTTGWLVLAAVLLAAVVLKQRLLVTNYKDILT